MLTVNTKDHADRHTFIAAALYAWSDNLAGRGRSVPVLLQQREDPAECSDFPFWCLGEKVSGNSGALLVLDSVPL